MNEEEVVRCLQCDWPVKRGESFVIAVDVCPVHGAETLGVIHLNVCAYDYSVKESRAATQKRRAGATRMS